MLVKGAPGVEQEQAITGTIDGVVYWHMFAASMS